MPEVARDPTGPRPLPDRRLHARPGRSASPATSSTPPSGSWSTAGRRAPSATSSTPSTTWASTTWAPSPSPTSTSTTPAAPATSPPASPMPGSRSTPSAPPTWPTRRGCWPRPPASTASRACGTTGAPWSRSIPARLLVLDEGDRLPLGAGRSLEVMYTPGHAKHHLVFFEAETGACLVGDEVGVAFPHGHAVQPDTPPPDFDPRATTEQLHRIAARRPGLSRVGPLRPPPRPSGGPRRGRATRVGRVAWVEEAGRAEDPTAAYRRWVLDASPRPRACPKTRSPSTTATPSGRCSSPASAAGSTAGTRRLSRRLSRAAPPRARRGRGSPGSASTIAWYSRRLPGPVPEAGRRPRRHVPDPQVAVARGSPSGSPAGSAPRPLGPGPGPAGTRRTPPAPRPWPPGCPPAAAAGRRRPRPPRGRSRARSTSISTGRCVVSPLSRR